MTEWTPARLAVTHLAIGIQLALWLPVSVSIPGNAVLAWWIWMRPA